MNLRFYLSWAIIVLLSMSCEEEVALTNVIDRITQTSIIFEDSRVEAISEKPIDKVFYLIRHAEKDSIPKDNPRLTETGDKRAVEVSDIFRQTRIDDIYSTMYTRTLWTVDTLSKAKGISIKPYDPSELKAFAESLRNNNLMKSALIVGHSNTTPQLAAFLANKDTETVEQIDEKEYDKLYIVVIHEDETADLKTLRFFTQAL